MAKRKERKVSVALDADAHQKLTEYKQEHELNTLSAAIRKLIAEVTTDADD